MDEKLLDQVSESFMKRPRYYEDLGRAHDEIMRCKDCQELALMTAITKLGMCPHCGNKRFAEITLLKQEEMDKIVSGELDFPDRDKFLAEFPQGVEV